MTYTSGERLKYTAVAGNNKTVMTDIPTADKTVTFAFTECKDGDNNYYPVVQINTQLWMAENLKTTKYRNGVSIGTTNPYNKDLTSEDTPKYQWAYAGDESNVATYGRLYTWYAVSDSRNVCPTDWHVPTDAEWTTLENYLIANGYNYDGATTGNKIAKALASTNLWNLYTGTGVVGIVGNTDYPAKRNATGFTALPGGTRSYNGTYDGIGKEGNWWSSLEFSIYVAWFRSIYFSYGYVYREYIVKHNGYSVRCLRDF
jgi:uncharacterized protein (TIGR02145 family)